MIYYEAPNLEVTFPTLFMAGGITGCWDWQQALVDELDSRETPVKIVNPRRMDWPDDDSEAAEFQIKWEHKMLAKADIISFWFPKDTLCPITLFELGKHMDREPIIGIEPGYAREFDIRTQLACEYGDTMFEDYYPIHTDIEGLAQAINHEAVHGHMYWTAE